MFTEAPHLKKSFATGLLAHIFLFKEAFIAIET